MAIFILEEKDWANAASSYIVAYIQSTLENFGLCNVALTGGKSAEVLYRHLSSYKDLLMNEDINYFFSDERCVEISNPDSNYSMALQALFKRCEIEKINIHRIKAEQLDLGFVCQEYAKLLPRKMDLTILGIGDDGHIASLFPNSEEIWCDKSVISVTDSRNNIMRISFGSKYILNSEKIVALAFGEKKSIVYSHAFSDFNDIQSMPCRLILHGDWFMTRKN